MADAGLAATEHLLDDLKRRVKQAKASEPVAVKACWPMPSRTCWPAASAARVQAARHAP
jgi:hypothetical protein